VKITSEIAKRWIAEDVSIVVITRGVDGLIGVTTHGTVTVPGVKVDVVDTIGAGGDSWRQ
jgi:fructokinase